MWFVSVHWPTPACLHVITYTHIQNRRTTRCQCKPTYINMQHSENLHTNMMRTHASRHTYTHAYKQLNKF